MAPWPAAASPRPLAASAGLYTCMSWVLPAARVQAAASGTGKVAITMHFAATCYTSCSTTSISVQTNVLSSGPAADVRCEIRPSRGVVYTLPASCAAGSGPAPSSRPPPSKASAAPPPKLSSGGTPPPPSKSGPAPRPPPKSKTAASPPPGAKVPRPPPPTGEWWWTVQRSRGLICHRRDGHAQAMGSAVSCRTVPCECCATPCCLHCTSPWPPTDSFRCPRCNALQLDLSQARLPRPQAPALRCQVARPTTAAAAPAAPPAPSPAAPGSR
jgi:hypothetical protein